MRLIDQDEPLAVVSEDVYDLPSFLMVLLETALDDLRLVRRGKVRDMYEVDDYLVMVATDRISAFDYVLASGIPDKGKVLTQISSFWFERTRPIVANHVLSTDAASFPGEARRSAKLLQGRSMLVART